MLGVVRCAADEPEVRFHGLFAVRRVLLREERCLVGRRVLEAVLTSSYCSCDSGEAYADTHLLGRYRSRAGYFFTQIHAVAVGVLRLRYAVCAQQHLRTTVLTVLTRFTQCAGYRINTGTPINICHDMPPMLYLRSA